MTSDAVERVRHELGWVGWSAGAQAGVGPALDDVEALIQHLQNQVNAAEDFRAEIVIDACTAPDADWGTIIDSLRARIEAMLTAQGDDVAVRLHEDPVTEDARRYGDVFCSVDRSIALYNRLGITEPWNEWEYPRRLAVLDMSSVRDMGEQ